MLWIWQTQWMQQMWMRQACWMRWACVDSDMLDAHKLRRIGHGGLGGPWTRWTWWTVDVAEQPRGAWGYGKGP